MLPVVTNRPITSNAETSGATMKLPGGMGFPACQLFFFNSIMHGPEYFFCTVQIGKLLFLYVYIMFVQHIVEDVGYCANTICMYTCVHSSV